MLGLLLKRTFIEIWDHAVLVFLLNLALLGLVFGLVMGLVGLGSPSPTITALLLLGGGGIVLWALLAGHRLLDRVVARAEAGRWWRAKGDIAATGLVPAFLAGLLALALLLGDLSLGRGGPLGIAMLVLAFWLLLLWLELALLVVPAIVEAKGRPLVAGRFLVLLVMDNPWFSLALVMIALPALVLGLGLLPGPFGLLRLAGNGLAMRLRRYSGDPGGPPDWTVLLAAERERQDRRRAISVLQPWRS